MPQHERFFICWKLKEGSIVVGNFTSVISMIACALAFCVFFRTSQKDDGHSKLVAFFVACYAIFYIVISRGLIRGVKDERRHKLSLWIGTSITTIVFLLTGVTVVLVLFSMGLFPESQAMTATVLGTTAPIILIACTLIYCTWGVALLWRIMGGDNTIDESV
ncbi:uncharacterized protein LOC118196118 [Stegodyphus dumicola]|uniref:uncharacterized protein LOC118196118 n=1 Tax=Stegodyphus dumicola TaxID=202533 RepID=UPI0015A8F2AB|nr:uncharacterized protein LOC118196118 [Stegodyphus dumicola]